MEWGILDNKTIVFVEWIGEIFACVSNGEEEIIVAKCRLVY